MIRFSVKCLKCGESFPVLIERGSAEKAIAEAAQDHEDEHHPKE